MSRKRSSKIGGFSGILPIGFLVAIAFMVNMRAIIALSIVSGIFYIIARLSFKGRRILINEGMEDIDRMSGLEFEQFLGRLFTVQGYNVTVTPASGDYGADLVLYKDSERIAVQAKRYSGKVGVEALQQVLGGRDYYGCNISRVITNSTFTKQAVQFAQRTNIELWDRTRLGSEIFAASCLTQNIETKALSE